MKITILVSHTPFLAILLDSNPLIYHRVYRLYNHLCIPVVSYPGRCKYISITSCLHSACCARWYRQNAEMRCFLTIVRKARSPARTTQPRCRIVAASKIASASSAILVNQTHSCMYHLSVEMKIHSLNTATKTHRYGALASFLHGTSRMVHHFW